MSEKGDDVDGRSGKLVVDDVQQNDKLNGTSPQNSEDLNKDSSAKALEQNGTREDLKELREKIEALNRQRVIERPRDAAEAVLKHLRAEFTKADSKSQDLAAKLAEAEKNLHQQVKERDETNSEPGSKLNQLHKQAKQQIQEIEKEKDDHAAQHHEVNEKSKQAGLQLPGLQQELVHTRQNASQYYQNSLFSSNPSLISFSQNPQTSQNTEKQPRINKWDVAEDVALMSAWCMISADCIGGKNHKIRSLWTEVKKLYDAAREENPKKLGDRNIDQMKGRFKRLNENVGQWVAAYQEAHRLVRSGMTQRDIENNAHKIFEQSGKKFHDSVVFNEVMCKYPKWALETTRDTTRSRPEEVDIEESGESTKRTRTTEEGDYCVNSNPDAPTSGGSSTQRPTGGEAPKKKKKGKCKVPNQIVEELRAMRVTRESEVDFMRKRLEFEEKKEQKKEERELKKMQLLHLNTLLQKEHLSSEEDKIKRSLMSKFYGNLM
uniref:glutathione S-transferase T3-like n=1 Tax=Erigeron canadensis TaxID=72917 RepID=UPI001CB89EE2|nr:glutathione S-transferase T3-like [Erigeron canadensis]XP_043632223.1 glutathione S-transferase T3-like [Erigeron canadensis]XP_043632224.1 glutathione S-transferase T3-like [Erigeron canadensis]